MVLVIYVQGLLPILSFFRETVFLFTFLFHAIYFLKEVTANPHQQQVSAVTGTWAQVNLDGEYKKHFEGYHMVKKDRRPLLDKNAREG